MNNKKIIVLILAILVIIVFVLFRIISLINTSKNEVSYVSSIVEKQKVWKKSSKVKVIHLIVLMLF